MNDNAATTGFCAGIIIFALAIGYGLVYGDLRDLEHYVTEQSIETRETVNERAQDEYWKILKECKQ